jgi:hypothetical protein
MAKASADTRATALLFSFSAVVLVLLTRALLLQRPGGVAALADILIATADRFLDGRGLLDLATRRNMVLLCHAILLVILRDAGLLGAPTRRRAAATETTDDSATVVVAPAAAAADAAAPVLTDSADPEGAIVVWRRTRDGAEQDAHHDDGSASGGRRPVRRRRQLRRSAQQDPAAASAVPTGFAAPALLTEQQPPLLVLSKEIVLVEDAPSAIDGEKSGFDRRMVVAVDEGAVASRDEQAEDTTELADDKRIEEFIAKQWSTIRHESLQLDRPSLQSRSRAIAAW